MSAYSTGPCTSCGQPDDLCAGGLLGQPICPTCTLFHGLAPDVHAELRRRRKHVVVIEGKPIRVGGGARATLLLAQQMVKKHRREEAEKGAGKA